jgi:hypothetical protein
VRQRLQNLNIPILSEATTDGEVVTEADLHIPRCNRYLYRICIYNWRGGNCRPAPLLCG